MTWSRAVRCRPRSPIEKGTRFMEHEATTYIVSLRTLLDVAFQSHLYSSLTPYAMMMSGNSAMTALAAPFMRSNAFRSLGFSKAYLLENLRITLDSSFLHTTKHFCSLTCGSLSHLYVQRSMYSAAGCRAARSSSHTHIWTYRSVLSLCPVYSRW